MRLRAAFIVLDERLDAVRGDAPGEALDSLIKAQAEASISVWGLPCRTWDGAPAIVRALMPGAPDADLKPDPGTISGRLMASLLANATRMGGREISPSLATAMPPEWPGDACNQC
jgi:hypothetical protein